jgi:hypothetical protein
MTVVGGAPFLYGKFEIAGRNVITSRIVTVGGDGLWADSRTTEPFV